MLTTVAVLTIVLGLMVSLARVVRDRSAQQLTRQTLRDLENLMRQYADHNGGALPPVQPLLAPGAGETATVPDEVALADAARRNNEQCIAALKLDHRLHQPMTASAAPPDAAASDSQEAAPAKNGADARKRPHRTEKSSSPGPTVVALSQEDPFELLPNSLSVYDHRTLRDAWGSPIVLMSGQHRLIGMAPSREGRDQSFFFSAGPDRKYLTRVDNLYSYDALGPAR